MKNFVDPRIAEDAQIGEALAPLKLAIKEVKADGHCLYRAVADQCRQHISALSEDLAKEVNSWVEGAEHNAVRRLAARALRAHREDFEPFCDVGDLPGFDAYCDRVERSAEWGGDLELQALSRALALPPPPLPLVLSGHAASLTPY